MSGTQGSISLPSTSALTMKALGNATANTTLSAADMDGYDVIVITQTTPAITYSTPTTTKSAGTRRIVFNAANSAHGFSLNTGSLDDTGGVVMPSYGQELIAIGGAWYAVGTAQPFLARGEFGIGDLGGITNSFIAHNIASATKSSSGTGWAAYSVTFTRRPPNDRYKVNAEFRGYMSTPKDDATVTWSVRDKTTTGFTVYLREAAGATQFLRLDITVTE